LNTTHIQRITEAEAKRLSELVSDASARRASNTFVLEGPHLVFDAITRYPERVFRIIATEQALEKNADLANALGTLKAKLHIISEKLAAKVSDTKSPQGVFAEVLIPANDLDYSKSQLILALDGVQDPGNLGTIMRTALWFNVKHLLSSASAVDQYNPKVIRSTQGAILDVAVERVTSLEDKLLALKERNIPIAVTSLEASSTSVFQFAQKKPGVPLVLVLGSEAHGVSEGIKALADHFLYIPKLGAGESLNVAVSAAIFLAELTK